MYIKAKKGLFNKETNDGLAVLSKNENKMFVLNNTACSIWKMCASKTSLDDILSKLSKKYGIEERDIGNFKNDCISLARQNPDLFEISDS